MEKKGKKATFIDITKLNLNDEIGEIELVLPSEEEINQVLKELGMHILETLIETKIKGDQKTIICLQDDFKEFGLIEEGLEPDE